MDIYQQFEKIRIFFNLNKKEFCDAINITQVSYNRYKNQDSTVSTDVICNVVSTFKISPHFIYSSLDDPKTWFNLYSVTNPPIPKNIIMLNKKLEELIVSTKIEEKLSGMHEEKNFWEKILFNPREDSLRFLALALQEIREQKIVTPVEPKKYLIEIIENYSYNMILNKLFARKEKEYLLEFINKLGNEECAIILSNIQIVIETIKKHLTAPFSQITLKLFELRKKS